MNTIVARKDHKINCWTDALKQVESSNPHLNKANLTKKKNQKLNAEHQTPPDMEDRSPEINHLLCARY